MFILRLGVFSFERFNFYFESFLVTNLKQVVGGKFMNLTHFPRFVADVKSITDI